MKQDYPDTGDQNWGCVKSAGNYVEVKATTGPNDNKAEWDEISWNGGQQVPGKTNNYRQFSRDSAAKFEVTPTIEGKGLKPLYIWVIWGTYTIKLSGYTDKDQVSTIVSKGIWGKDYGDGTQLGSINYCDTPELTKMIAGVRTQGVVNLAPSGIGDVVEAYDPYTFFNTWEMIRRRTTRAYQNGTLLTPYDDVPDPTPSIGLDVNPSGDKGKNKLFDADEPGVRLETGYPPHIVRYPYPSQFHTVEMYSDYIAWGQIWLDDFYRCTNKVEYNYQVKINFDQLVNKCPTIDLNSVSYGHLDMPSKSAYSQ